MFETTVTTLTCARVRACVRACLRACVRARARAYVNPPSINCINREKRTHSARTRKAAINRLLLIGKRGYTTHARTHAKTNTIVSCFISIYETLFFSLTRKIDSQNSLKLYQIPATHFPLFHAFVCLCSPTSEFLMRSAWNEQRHGGGGGGGALPFADVARALRFARVAPDSDDGRRRGGSSGGRSGGALHPGTEGNAARRRGTRDPSRGGCTMSTEGAATKGNDVRPYFMNWCSGGLAPPCCLLERITPKAEHHSPYIKISRGNRIQIAGHFSSLNNFPLVNEKNCLISALFHFHLIQPLFCLVYQPLLYL